MTAFRDVERVGRGVLLNAQADDSRLAVESQRRAVVLGAQFDAGDVAETREAAVGVRAQDDVRELGGVGELRDRVDRVGVWLSLGRGRRAQAADADRHVLLLQRVHHVAGIEPLRRQQPRIEPDPHRVLALAEDADTRDAGHAREVVDDVQLRVVAEFERAVLFAVGRERDAHHERSGVFRDGDADLLNAGRERAESALGRVLHVGGGDVEIDAEVERQRNRRDALRARRTDVAQPLHRVDGLLEGRRDLRLDRLRARSDIDRGDGYHRRRDLRILRDRQRRNHDPAADEHDQRADDGQDGPAEECLGHVSPKTRSLRAELRSGRRLSPGLGGRRPRCAAHSRSGPTPTCEDGRA